MAGTVTTSKPKLTTTSERPSTDHGGGFGGDGPRERGGDGRGSDGPDPAALAVQRYKLGVWVGFGGIIMVFAAFTSAMVVRKGLGGDWKSFDLPAVLWFSTTILLASSFSIEKAKRAMRRGLEPYLRRWLQVTAVLGAAFLISQLVGWRQLADRGIYVATNPSSSFFYLLTAVHGLHLFGGLLALTYVVFRVWRKTVWATREAAIEGATLYWHFMDGLWVYLFALLLFWR